MITDIINEIIEAILNFENTFIESEKHKNANIPLVIEVYTSRLLGNKTQEEIGQNYGVGRERVRQVETYKLYQKLKTIFSTTNNGINPIAEHLFNTIGDIITIDEININKLSKYKNIIKECYLKDKTTNRIFNIDLKNKIICRKKYDLKNLFSLVEKDLIPAQIYKKEDIIIILFNKLCLIHSENNSNKNKEYASILYDCAFNVLPKLVDFVGDKQNVYYAKSEKYNREIKDAKFSYWFKKLYPNGIHLPQDNPLVKKNVKDIGESNIAPLLSKVEELAENISYRSNCNYVIRSKYTVTYDTGKYIHIDYIKELSETNYDFLVNLANKLYKLFDDKCNCINTWTVFASLKDDFKNAGIQSHELLFAMLKVLNLPQFEYVNERKLMLLAKPNIKKENLVIKNEKNIPINKSELRELRNYIKTTPFNLTIKFNEPEKIEDKNLSIKDIEDEFKNLDSNTVKTEFETSIKARIGQDKLRKQLLEEHHSCELCGIELEDILIASHIKPWKDSNDTEKLDINNVLLLCSMHDALFDKGFISFNEKGEIIISKYLNETTQALLNIHEESKIENVSPTKSNYLKFHYTKHKHNFE